MLRDEGNEEKEGEDPRADLHGQRFAARPFVGHLVA